jgi:hypothetical protein
MGRLHDLSILRMMGAGGQAQNLAVYVAAAAGLLATLTGYFLAIPARWRGRQRDRQRA